MDEGVVSILIEAIAVVRVNKQVESIVVEGEIRTVTCRHSTPCIPATIVVIFQVVITAIVIGSYVPVFTFGLARTIICFKNQIIDIFGKCLFDIGSTGIAVVEPIEICLLLSYRHQITCCDEFGGRELDGAGADVSLFSFKVRQGSCLSLRNRSTFIVSITIG